jgi:hypothetical protein
VRRSIAALLFLLPLAAHAAQQDFFANEGNAGITTVQVFITSKGPANGNIVGQYQTVDGTATVADNDYLPQTSDFFIPSGSTTSNPITLQIVGDTKIEPDETFSLDLFNISNGGSLETGPYVIHIINDDAAGLKVSSPSVSEGNVGTTLMNFTVTINAAVAVAVQAQYSTADGTAKAGQDYQPASGTLLFPIGTSQQTVTVLVNGDTTVELNETFALNVNIVGGESATGIGTIVNDDVPAVSVSSPSVTEGNSGTTSLAFAVTLTTPAAVPIQATFVTSDGTATAGDYQPATGTLVFNPGETTKIVNITVNGDTTFEANETLGLTVTPIGGAAASGIGTIVNDDAPSVSVADVRVTEGNSGTTPMNFVVTLNAASSTIVQAGYTTADGTATAGQDYQAAAGTLVFDPGQTQKTVTVNVNGDTNFEPDETLTLTVTPAGGTPVTATGTIVNDDVVPVAAIRIVSGNNQRARLGQSLPQPLVVEVTSSQGAPSSGVAVNWKVTKGDAVVNPASSTTNAQGRASTTVTLNSVGAVEVQASVAQLAPVTFTLASETQFEQRATGPVAVPVARALDTVCAENDANFAGACRTLSLLDDAQLTPALERVAPQQSGAQSKVASEFISAVTSGIRSRLQSRRQGTRRLDVQKLSLSFGGQTIPVGMLSMALLPQQTASAPEEEKDYSGWSGFLSGNLGTGERLGHSGQLGFDLDTQGLMLGVDRQFGDAVLGVSANLMSLDSKFSQGAGKLDTTAYALSIYGSRGGLLAGGAAPSAGTGTHYDGVHLDGSFTLGRNRYDATHVVDVLSSTARSKNDGDIYALTAGTGVDAHNGKTDFELSLSGTWSRAHIDDLTEEGSGPLILFVQGHDIDSTVATASANVRSVWAVPFGDLLPSFRGEMIHEFKSGARLVTARFLKDKLNTGFTVPVDTPDSNYGKLSAGLQAVFAHGVSAFVEVTQDVLRSDLHFRTVQFNLSKSF